MTDPVRRAPGVPAAPISKAKEIAEAPRQEGGIQVTVNGVRVEVSPELEAAVHRAYKGLSSPPAEMTTTQAAEFLDVSRPFVIKLIHRGELPCRMVGSHRRIPYLALVGYREKMFHQAKKAADEMVGLSEELGLDKPDGPSPEGQ